ncbi:MAG: hypothetical protein CME06_05095 [Gemmatimonadetes bacterium]|jgi:hypothetical protein|nr:hypothetical protein [Gemmatimonadota bacterium]
MEDRISPILYLELSDLSLENEVPARAEEVLALPSVERATWWRNLNPHRKDFEPDFVFRLPDFGTLSVFEAQSDFVPPSLPDGIRGLHFRHYPRPGQGFLSAEKTMGLMLVLVSPREESGAQALRDWADFVHIPPLAVGEIGFKMITPYENVNGGEPLYMHFYETANRYAESALQAEVHAVPAWYGGVDTEAYRHWQVHDQLVVDYLNTFERVGEAAAR